MRQPSPQWRNPGRQTRRSYEPILHTVHSRTGKDEPRQQRCNLHQFFDGANNKPGIDLQCIREEVGGSGRNRTKEQNECKDDPQKNSAGSRSRRLYSYKIENFIARTETSMRKDG
jgi:hypothetical protein